WTVSGVLREGSIPQRFLAIQGQSPPPAGRGVQSARSGGPFPHRCRQCARLGCAAVCRRAAPLEAPAAFPLGDRRADEGRGIFLASGSRGSVCAAECHAWSSLRDWLVLDSSPEAGLEHIFVPRPLRLRVEGLT